MPKIPRCQQAPHSLIHEDTPSKVNRLYLLRPRQQIGCDSSDVAEYLHNATLVYTILSDASKGKIQEYFYAACHLIIPNVSIPRFSPAIVHPS